jgi:hypothetical protein
MSAHPCSDHPVMDEMNTAVRIEDKICNRNLVCFFAKYALKEHIALVMSVFCIIQLKSC